MFAIIIYAARGLPGLGAASDRQCAFSAATSLPNVTGMQVLAGICWRRLAGAGLGMDVDLSSFNSQQFQEIPPFHRSRQRAKCSHVTLLVVRSLPDCPLPAPVSVCLQLALAIGSLCPHPVGLEMWGARDSAPPLSGAALSQ